MNPQEAKEVLIHILHSIYNLKKAATEETLPMLKKCYDALVWGTAATEKQIKKKPSPDNTYYGVGKCPLCGAVFLDKSTNYCGNCGQALDWSL